MALTEPGFENLLVIVVGWVQTTGRHAGTQALVVTDVAKRRHHEAFHRFFSRGTWSPDRLGYWLFERVRGVLDLDQHGLRVVIDDTLAAKNRKKTELARDMIDVFHGWVGDHRVEVAADAAYCNATVTRGLPASFVLFGAMRPDAVLTELPDERAAAPTGRRRRRGVVLPKLEALARDDSKPWRTCEADLYGQRRKVRYKEVCGQW